MFKALRDESQGPNARRGQSTTEYLILFTAVLMVVVVFLFGNSSNPSSFQIHLTNSFNLMARGMDNAANRLVGP